jgi:hypothetical protein
MMRIALRIDAFATADLSDALAFAVATRERIRARIVAASTVLVVVVRIDTEFDAEYLITRATGPTLTLPVGTGHVASAAVTAPTAVERIGLGADTGLTAFHRSVLALLLFPLFLRVRLGEEACAQNGAEPECGERDAELATVQKCVESERKIVEAIVIHAAPLARPFASVRRKRRAPRCDDTGTAVGALGCEVQHRLRAPCYRAASHLDLVVADRPGSSHPYNY